MRNFHLPNHQQTNHCHLAYCCTTLPQREPQRLRLSEIRSCGPRGRGWQRLLILCSFYLVMFLYCNSCYRLPRRFAPRNDVGRFLHSLRSVEMTESRLGQRTETARSKDRDGSVEMTERRLGRRTEAARSKGPAKKRAKVVIISQNEK